MIDKSALPGWIGQLLRFGLVGGFVTLLGATLYYVPATWLGVPPLLANLLGYAVAVVFGYVLHGRISFAGHGGRDQPLVRTGRFFLVSLVSLGLNSLFVYLLTGPLGGPTWWPLVPMLFVTPIFTFLFNRHWVFA